jgi:hypothetical protein
VTAGTYWIMVEVPSQTVVCADHATTNTIYETSASYGVFPANPATASFGPDVNFYVVAR